MRWAVTRPPINRPKCKPKPKVVMVEERCRQYPSDAEAGRLLVRGGKPKKPLMLAPDRGRIEGHVIPLLGKLAVAAVTKQDVEVFMHVVAEGRTAKQRRTKPRTGVSRNEIPVGHADAIAETGPRRIAEYRCAVVSDPQRKGEACCVAEMPHPVSGAV